MGSWLLIVTFCALVGNGNVGCQAQMAPDFHKDRSDCQSAGHATLKHLLGTPGYLYSGFHCEHIILGAA
jgi:hypothetical protein